MSQNSNTDAEDILSELETTKEEISTPESEIVEKSKIEEQPKTENIHKQKQNVSQHNFQTQKEHTKRVTTYRQKRSTK